MPVDAVETGARGGVGSGKEPRGSGFKLAGRDPFALARHAVLPACANGPESQVPCRQDSERVPLLSGSNDVRSLSRNQFETDSKVGPRGYSDSGGVPEGSDWWATGFINVIKLYRIDDFPVQLWPWAPGSRLGLDSTPDPSVIGRAGWSRGSGVD
eukprot:3744705-Rhodomonas_salina.2